MGRKVVKNIDELIEVWKKGVSYIEHDPDEEDLTDFIVYKSGFSNLDIDFELRIPFLKEKLQEVEDYVHSNINPYSFTECNFLKDVYITPSDNAIQFTDNCIFEKRLFSSGNKNNITFKGCDIKELDFEDAIFGSEENKNDKKGKVRFHSCNLYNVNFRNTTFNSLADFWNSTFHNPTTFYKTDFRDITVFSAVTFKENVLFTYALIDKLMILRGAFPEKGFDISLAIINGNLSLFDFKFSDYNTYSKIHKDVRATMKKYSGKGAYIKAYEEIYEDAVSYHDLIPIENKRETYRILKHQLEGQKNFIDAILFKVKESKTHLKQSWQQLRHGVHFFNPISNLGISLLNGASSWFGLSYAQAGLFTVLAATFFFNLTLSHIGSFEFTWDYEQWQWEYFVQFLNPTHRFDFMKAIDPNPRTWFFIWDFIGRLFVGYGIYQFIQAFRKYK